MSFKDIYLDEVERIAADLEDQGLSPDAAYDRASDLAYDSARERALDAADSLRKRERGG